MSENGLKLTQIMKKINENHQKYKKIIIVKIIEN